MQSRTWAQKIYAVTGAILGTVLVLALLAIAVVSMGFGSRFTG